MSTIKHVAMEWEQRTLASPAFKFFSDGNTQNEVVETGLPEGLSPFVVRASGNHFIPINVVVFALHAEHAKQRVLDHLTYVSLHAEYEGERHPEIRPEKQKALEYLSKIGTGELIVEASEFPLHRISKVQWASNDGVL